MTKNEYNQARKVLLAYAESVGCSRYRYPAIWSAVVLLRKDLKIKQLKPEYCTLAANSDAARLFRMEEFYTLNPCSHPVILDALLDHAGRKTALGAVCFSVALFLFPRDAPKIAEHVKDLQKWEVMK